MNIHCNGELIIVENNISLHVLLESKEMISKKGIAVAVNNSVIQKQNWESHVLQENDKVLIISATKGG